MPSLPSQVNLGTHLMSKRRIAKALGPSNEFGKTHHMPDNPSQVEAVHRMPETISLLPPDCTLVRQL